MWPGQILDLASETVRPVSDHRKKDISLLNWTLALLFGSSSYMLCLHVCLWVCALGWWLCPILCAVWGHRKWSCEENRKCPFETGHVSSNVSDRPLAPPMDSRQKRVAVGQRLRHLREKRTKTHWPDQNPCCHDPFIKLRIFFSLLFLFLFLSSYAKLLRAAQ